MQHGQIRRRGNVWQLRYWTEVLENGKPVRKRVARTLAPFCDEYRTKKSLESLAADVLAPVNTGKAIPRSSDTVDAFLQNFLAHCEKNLRPSTVKGYRDMYKLLAPHLDGAKLHRVRTSHVTQWLKALADYKPRAHTTLRNVKCFLSSAFRWGKNSDVVEGNPVRDSMIPRGKPKGERAPYTLDETAAMLRVLPEPSRTVVLCAALTGLRLSELKGLRWEDFSNGEVMVQRAVWQGQINQTKTLTSRAAVPVVPFLLEALAEHKARNSEKTGFIFHGSTGQPLRLENIYQREMRPALEKAGIQWRGWHPFRYATGTLLHSLGASDKVIQGILRHSNVNTTLSFYIKPPAEEARAAMRKLETALGKTLGKREKLA